MEKKRCYGCMKLTEHNICEYCGYDNSKNNELHQLPAGTILKNQYFIGKVLGQGGYGITYFGWDMHLNIPIAVKEYFPGFLVVRDHRHSTHVQNPNRNAEEWLQKNKQRFLQEARSLARFSQKSEIVQIKNLFMENETIYLVMEYLDGVTLKDYVREQGGKLSFHETLAILRPLMGTLENIHRNGLIHRDISPDNIMLMPDGGLKLMDFGAVKELGDVAADKELTQSTEAIVKHGFAAIEQYQRRGALGPWTDVYALCATIYFCITGEIPMDASERLLEGKELDFAVHAKGASAVQLDALKKATEIPATDRLASMGELYQLLYADEGEQELRQRAVDGVRAQRAGAEIVERDKTDAGIAKRNKVDAVKEDKTKADSVNSLSEEKISQFGTDKKEDRKFLKFGILTGVFLLVLSIGVVFVKNPFWKSQQSEDNTQTQDENMADFSETQQTEYTAEYVREVLENGESLCGQYSETISWEYRYSPSRDEYILILQGEGELMEPLRTKVGDLFINSIQVEEGIRRIGTNFFTEQVGLYKLVLPASLEVIEVNAFLNCWNLKNIVFIGETTEIQCTDTETPFTVTYDDYYLGDCTFYGSGTVASFAETFGFEYAAAPAYSGQCGNDVYWRFENGTLHLEGTGETWDYYMNGETEWEQYRELIRGIHIGEEITRLNGEVFAGISGIEYLNLENVQEVGYRAFSSCDIRELEILNSQKIEPGAFVNCDFEKVTIAKGTICAESFEDCKIKEFYFGKDVVITTNPTDGESGILACEDMIFHVYKDSNAESYSIENGISYKIIEE